MYIRDNDGNYIPTPTIRGADGREVELRATSEYIQWRYKDLEWQNLIAIADLTDGIDAAELLRVDAENIRVLNEYDRISAESARAIAENLRVSKSLAFEVLEDYNNSKTYVPLNKVVYQGSTYQNIATCIGKLPTDVVYWKMIARVGEKGDAFTYDDFTPEQLAQLKNEIPAGGLSGQYLKYVSSGTAEWDTPSAEEFGAVPLSAALPTTTGGTAPYFTIDPYPAITSYADGQQWTVQFHEDSETPNLDVNQQGAAPILAAIDIPAPVKAGQIMRVVRKGSNFFASGSGGASSGVAIEIVRW